MSKIKNPLTKWELSQAWKRKQAEYESLREQAEKDLADLLEEIKTIDGPDLQEVTEWKN